MSNRVLKVHPNDNVIVALSDIKKGEIVKYDEIPYEVATDVPAKHKFAESDFEIGEEIYMYGVLVGKAQQKISKGEWITTFNVRLGKYLMSLSLKKDNLWVFIGPTAKLVLPITG
jgi:altronate hydrolase